MHSHVMRDATPTCFSARSRFICIYPDFRDASQSNVRGDAAATLTRTSEELIASPRDPEITEVGNHMVQSKNKTD